MNFCTRPIKWCEEFGEILVLKIVIHLNGKVAPYIIIWKLQIRQMEKVINNKADKQHGFEIPKWLTTAIEKVPL